jgi:hypothetical protein
MLAAAILVAACGSSFLGDTPGAGNWRLHIERAENEGLHVYWLGPPSFAAEGMNFVHLEGPARPEDRPGNAITLHYFDEPVRSKVHITTFSPSQWIAERDRLLVRADVPESRWSRTTIAGRQADLISTPMGTRPVNSLEAVIEFDDAVVYATTNSTVGQGGVELNSLVDATVFIDVLNHLKPYDD